MTIRLFLLDDQEIVRIGMRRLVEAESDLEVVGEASTLADALLAIPTTRPDVAVLDVQLPDGTGIELCRDIRSRWPEVACLIFTAFAEEAALLSAMVAGAAGYLGKSITGPEFANAVRRVASGESLLDAASTDRLSARVRRSSAEAKRLGSLSAQECRVLDLIAAGATNQQISATLHLSEKTVKNYVSRLLTKLDLRNRTEAAILSLRHRGCRT